MSRSETTPRSLLPLHPLEFRILLVLSEGEAHGYNIVKEIERRETRLPKIYPANLYRRIRDLSRKRLLSDCRPPRGSAVDSRRRYFRLTELGRMVLEEEAARIDGLAREVERMGVGAPAWGK